MKHELNYRVYNLLISMNELPELDCGSMWFGHNRVALLSFYDKDHGARDGTDVRIWVRKHLDKAGLTDAGSHISLMCFPRVLGYVFNPLSIYFCRNDAGQLKAILYEVKNTFGEQHGYLFQISDSDQRHLTHACAKEFYVSPFIGMQADYAFDIVVPDEDFSLYIRQSTPAGETLQASWRGKHVEWSEKALRRCFWQFPLLPFQIIWGIHWHAIILWLKKAKFHQRPQRVDGSVTTIKRGQ
jgi:DUF1365 family protein